jgi:hypothetical protein
MMGVIAVFAAKDYCAGQTFVSKFPVRAFPAGDHNEASAF